MFFCASCLVLFGEEGVVAVDSYYFATPCLYVAVVGKGTNKVLARGKSRSAHGSRV